MKPIFSPQNPFWQSTRVLLRYRRLLVFAFVGAVVSSLCFGAGLSMLLPTFHLLLGERQELHELIREHLSSKSAPISTLGRWLEGVTPTDPFWAFVSVMGVVAVLSVIGSVGRYMHGVNTITASARAAMHWRDQVYDRLIRSPMSHLLEFGTADYMARIVIDTSMLSRGYQAVMGKSVAKIFNAMAALAGALYLNWQLTLLGLVGVPAIIGVLRKFGNRIRRATRRSMKQQGRMLQRLRESMGDPRVVKVHVAEGVERRRFHHLSRVLFQQQLRARRAKALSGPVVETLSLIGVCVAAAFASWYIFRQGVEPEEFLTVLVMLAAMGASLKPLSSLHNQLAECQAAAERVMLSLEMPQEPLGRHHQSLPALPRHRREVAFESIEYRYPKQADAALRGVSLRVGFGQTVAIVGGNGSGKTTLLSMLPRLIEPERGRVLIDGVDVRDVNLRSLRGQMAVVPQHSVLFEGTIAQNIAYGLHGVTREQVEAAAKMAFAHEFVVKLPLGYDAMLSEGGEGLSGGQKQRLCIARAVLRDPAILILDEATSQIDSESETRINDAIRQLRHGRTTFLIAHRLSTVVDADLIVVMADGRIAAQGTHPQLLETCPIYQSLTRSQLVTSA